MCDGNRTGRRNRRAHDIQGDSMHKSEGTLSFSISVRALRNIVVGIVIGAMLTGGVAVAAGNNGKYTGCLTSDGEVHKVAKGKKALSPCAAGETKFTWKSKGKRGKRGPQGVAGATGPQGPVGPKGEQGPQGQTGPPGDKGEPGPAGATGPQGIAGPKGETGPVGPKGDRGFAGPTGRTGPKGDLGPEGPVGDPAAIPSGAVRDFRFISKTFIIEEDERPISYRATCRDTERVIGGGFELEEDDNVVYRNGVEGWPSNSWRVEMEADDVGDTLTVHATCAVLNR